MLNRCRHANSCMSYQHNANASTAQLTTLRAQFCYRCNQNTHKKKLAKTNSCCEYQTGQKQLSD